MPFPDIDHAIDEFRNGRFLIILDELQHEESFGYITIAADHVTLEAINFVTNHAHGWLGLCITQKKCKDLGLAPLSSQASEPEFFFTQSIRHAESSSGFTSAEKLRTIQAVLHPASRPSDFAAPGFIFPIQTIDEGVLRRPGYPEAAVDLALLANLTPVSVLSPILDEEGRMLQSEEVIQFAEKNKISVIGIKDFVQYQMRTSSLLVKIEETVKLPTKFGEFTVHIFQEKLHPTKQHLAFTMGDLSTPEPVLVRVHSECFTGDVLKFQGCNCSEMLELSFQSIARENRGALVYIRQDERLNNRTLIHSDDSMKVLSRDDAYLLGHSSDNLDVGRGAHILKDLGIEKMRLLTKNKIKRSILEGYGLEIVEEVQIGQHLKPRPTQPKSKIGHLSPLI